MKWNFAFTGQGCQFKVYPASRGYIFAVWAGVRKVASADNRSILTIVHAKNSSRDSQATGWSNLLQFCGNQTCVNYLRTTLLELLFSFCAFPPLVLSILAGKNFLGSSFIGKYHYAANFSKSCLLSGELNSNWQFFPASYNSNYTHVKDVFEPEQEIILWSLGQS